MELDEIKTKVICCTNCELCDTRTNAVPGKGNQNADIIFVGEAPGRNEDKLGEPFVGAAGKKLSVALEDAGMSREEAYITNVVKCRPPNNRVPTQKERNSCISYLENEIKVIKPKIICVMGNTAFHSLLDGSDIMKFRGKTFLKNNNLYFVSLHPAAAIYNQKLVETLNKDIKKLAKILQEIKRGKDIKIDFKTDS